MKSFGRTIVFTALSSLLLATSVRAVEPGFIPLLDREHTTGWKQTGPGDVSMKDGVVTTSSANGNGVFWYSPRVFNDFILKLEFKGTQKEFNSGIFFRFPAPQFDAAMPNTTGNEVAICDGLNDDRPTGSIYHFQDSSSAPMKRGAWNEYEITCIKNRVKVVLNGQSINDFTGLRQLTGFIGLQCHPRGPVQFRNIRIRDLSVSVPFAPVQSTSASSAPLATIQSDPSQPRIQVIKDQGPNATEWAMTPLDETIPADIRQNLTLMREDLLDESSKAPKARVEAYSLASDYCDKLLTALNQRELARVQAGYRAAQAEANKNISNQALDARRNYMMSWPQYAREESQRAALRENESDKADVKKERIKVEWATRADAMRKHLDDLYVRFREELRQSSSKK